MQSSKKSYTTIGTIMLALVLSNTACTSNDPSAETTSPSASATATMSATATPRPSQTADTPHSASPSVSAAPASAPAPPTTEAPPAEPSAPAPPAAAAPAPAPNPAINPQPATESFSVTAEDAIAIIAEYHDNNPDLQYEVKDNGDGTFDVSVTSLSIVAQGGDGKAGTYLVRQDRVFALK